MAKLSVALPIKPTKAIIVKHYTINMTTSDQWRTDPITEIGIPITTRIINSLFTIISPPLCLLNLLWEFYKRKFWKMNCYNLLRLNGHPINRSSLPPIGVFTTSVILYHLWWISALTLKFHFESVFAFERVGLPELSDHWIFIVFPNKKVGASFTEIPRLFLNVFFPLYRKITCILKNKLWQYKRM